MKKEIIALLFFAWLLFAINIIAAAECTVCEDLSQYAKSDVFVSVSEGDQKIQAQLFTTSYSGGQEIREGVKNAPIVVYATKDNTPVGVSVIYTDDEGNAEFDLKQDDMAGNAYNSTCKEYLLVYCHAKAGCGFRQCFEVLGINLSAVDYNSILDIPFGLPTLAEPPNPQDPLLVLPAAGVTSYCPPPPLITPSLPVFCLPLAIIFALLGGAMYLSGRNPFAMFDLSTPRMTKAIKYTTRSRGGGFDIMTVVNAALSGTKAITKSGREQMKAEAKKGGGFATTFRMATGINIGGLSNMRKTMANIRIAGAEGKAAAAAGQSKSLFKSMGVGLTSRVPGLNLIYGSVKGGEAWAKGEKGAAAVFAAIGGGLVGLLKMSSLGSVIYNIESLDKAFKMHGSVKDAHDALRNHRGVHDEIDLKKGTGTRYEVTIKEGTKPGEEPKVVMVAYELKLEKGEDGKYRVVGVAEKGTSVNLTDKLALAQLPAGVHALSKSTFAELEKYGNTVRFFSAVATDAQKEKLVERLNGLSDSDKKELEQIKLKDESGRVLTDGDGKALTLKDAVAGERLDLVYGNAKDLCDTNRTLQKELTRILEQHQQVETELGRLEADMKGLSAQLAAAEKSKDSPEKEQRISALTAQIDDLKSNARTLHSEAVEIEEIAAARETDINKNKTILDGLGGEKLKQEVEGISLHESMGVSALKLTVAMQLLQKNENLQIWNENTMAITSEALSLSNQIAAQDATIATLPELSPKEYAGIKDKVEAAVHEIEAQRYRLGAMVSVYDADVSVQIEQRDKQLVQLNTQLEKLEARGVDANQKQIQELEARIEQLENQKFQPSFNASEIVLSKDALGAMRGEGGSIDHARDYYLAIGELLSSETALSRHLSSVKLAMYELQTNPERGAEVCMFVKALAEHSEEPSTSAKIAALFIDYTMGSKQQHLVRDDESKPARLEQVVTPHSEGERAVFVAKLQVEDASIRLMNEVQTFAMTNSAEMSGDYLKQFVDQQREKNPEFDKRYPQIVEAYDAIPIRIDSEYEDKRKGLAAAIAVQLPDHTVDEFLKTTLTGTGKEQYGAMCTEHEKFREEGLKVAEQYKSGSKDLPPSPLDPFVPIAVGSGSVYQAELDKTAGLILGKDTHIAATYVRNHAAALSAGEHQGEYGIILQSLGKARLGIIADALEHDLITRESAAKQVEELYSSTARSVFSTPLTNPYPPERYNVYGQDGEFQYFGIYGGGGGSSMNYNPRTGQFEISTK